MIKRSDLSIETLDPSFYLGGDLGIDSIEMLEIWFGLEKELRMRVPDLEKREIYTVGQVLEVLKRHYTPSQVAAREVN